MDRPQAVGRGPGPHQPRPHAHRGHADHLHRRQRPLHLLLVPHPGTGDGFVHGHPIDWSESHLLVRLDPNWNYHSRTFIPNTDTAKIEKNIKQQYSVGRRIFESYAAKKPDHPLSWHLIGPRVKDSIFDIQRVS